MMIHGGRRKQVVSSHNPTLCTWRVHKYSVPARISLHMHVAFTARTTCCRVGRVTQGTSLQQHSTGPLGHWQEAAAECTVIVPGLPGEHSSQLICDCCPGRRPD